MTTFKGNDYFSSGPSRVSAGAAAQEIRVSRFPGIDGEHHLLMGRPGREIIQEGTLSGSSQSVLQGHVDDITEQIGTSGALVDDLGWTYSDCVLVSFRLVGPRRLDASGKHCVDYEMTYRQPTASTS